MLGTIAKKPLKVAVFAFTKRAGNSTELNSGPTVKQNFTVPATCISILNTPPFYQTCSNDHLAKLVVLITINQREQTNPTSTYLTHNRIKHRPNYPY